jgi:hypothetical protein
MSFDIGIDNAASASGWGQPKKQRLGNVGAEAANRTQSLFTKQQFVKGVPYKLSSCLCLCRYNAMQEGGVAGIFVRASGIAIKPGLS